MATFSWQDSYRVGNELIDSQHQYLFALATEVVDAKDKSELTNNAMKLFKYVREHFDHEETVMRKTGYPAHQEHVAMHETLINQLAAISSDIEKDRWSASALRQFMEEWLLGHIVETDTKLAQSI